MQPAKIKYHKGLSSNIINKQKERCTKGSEGDIDRRRCTLRVQAKKDRAHISRSMRSDPDRGGERSGPEAKKRAFREDRSVTREIPIDGIAQISRSTRSGPKRGEI